MNKSPIFYIIGAIIIVLLGYLLFTKYNDRSSNLNNEPKIEIDHTTSRPDLSKGTFVFEGIKVNLENGRAETQLPDNSALSQTTILTDKIAYGDLNHDNKEDAVALFVQEGAGTGVFMYVAAYVSGTVRYNGSNAIYIGDRLIPQNITINNEVIKVIYLDRKEGEPFTATPTEVNTKSFIFVDGELKELK
jgi:hypothetical protein